MHHNANNHHQPGQSIQAPPSLLTQVLGRIQQAEQKAEDPEQLFTAFASSDWSLRAAAIEQLAHAEREVALPWLERALSDEHPAVRAWAVYALAQHEAAKLIRPALRDPDWQVREAAMLALGIPDEQIPDEFPTFAQSDSDVEADQPARALAPRRPLPIAHSGGAASMKSIDQQPRQPFPGYEEPRTFQVEEAYSESRIYEEARAFQIEEARSARKAGLERSERSIAQRGRLPRFFSLVAAVLVGAVLVGSMVLLYSPSRSVVSGPAPQGVKSHTATASVPPECRDVQDQIDETLCVQHKETILNITKNFSGHELTFVRVYADPSRLMLIYTTTDSPRTDAISFLNVTIQQGIKLGGGGGLQIAYEDTMTQRWYYQVNFETQNVPADTKTLHVEAITDAFSGTSTPLSFTTPFHSTQFDATQKSVPVNQTVTSKGVALTLDHLAFTIGGTFIYLKTTTPQASMPGVYLNSLSINGQQVASFKDALGGTDPLVIQLPMTLQDEPGAWVAQISAGISASPASGATWTFHFTVTGATSTK